MIIFGWIVWGIACIIMLTFLLAGVTQRDSSLRNLHLRSCFLIMVGILVTVITSISKLHLLWWVPVAFFFNQLVLSPLIIIGRFRRRTRKFEKEMNAKFEKTKK